MKRFNGICIISPDVQRLRDFYQSVLGTSSDGSDFFAAIEVSGGSLTLFAEQGMEEMAPQSMRDAGRGAYTIEFEVDDVDREYQHLLALNVSVVKVPTTQPWGRRSVWFRDPDGNLVNFYAGTDRSRLTPKDVVQQYFNRLLNKHDLSVCDELLAADYRDHDAPPGTLPGPASTREFVAQLLAQYPDMLVEIEDLISEESRVFARIVWHGHHHETGAEFKRTGHLAFRIDAQGRIAERRSVYE